MKSIVRIFFAALFITACSHNEPLIWDIVSVEREGDGVRVAIDYPFAFGGDQQISELMNSQIEHYFIDALPDGDLFGGHTLDSAITDMIRAKEEDEFISHLQYEIVGGGSVTLVDTLTSVKLDRAYYTGGANMGYNTTFLNFNGKGEIVPLSTIVDTAELAKLSRIYFMQSRGFSDSTSAEEAYMFIDPKDIPLAEAVGFDSLGVVIYYNYYEVGPRPFGATEFTIPYSTIDSLGLFKQ